MKAREIKLAATRAMGNPSNALGHLLNSIRSRTLANRTMASRKPTPPVIP